MYYDDADHVIDLVFFYDFLLVITIVRVYLKQYVALVAHVSY